MRFASTNRPLAHTRALPLFSCNRLLLNVYLSTHNFKLCILIDVKYRVSYLTIKIYVFCLLLSAKIKAKFLTNRDDYAFEK